MRLPFPKRRPNEGIWGGFGSKAPNKAYQPPVGARGDSTEAPPADRRSPVSKGRRNQRPAPRRRRWWRGRTTERLHPLEHAVIGIVAIVFGALAFVHANTRGGEVFDRPFSQGPRDSGFYFFVMAIGALAVLAGLYQFPLALKEWRRRLRQRRLDRGGSD